jgi:hypothetical protein
MVIGKLAKYQVGLEMDFKAMEYELNSSGSEHGPVAGSSKHKHRNAGSLKG